MKKVVISLFSAMALFLMSCGPEDMKDQTNNNVKKQVEDVKKDDVVPVNPDQPVTPEKPDVPPKPEEPENDGPVPGPDVPVPNPNEAPVTNPDGAPATNPDGAPATNPEGAPATNPEGAPATNPGGTPVANPDEVAPNPNAPVEGNPA